MGTGCGSAEGALAHQEEYTGHELIHGNTVSDGGERRPFFLFFIFSWSFFDPKETEGTRWTGK